MTVLFADLVGFTQRAEEMDPEDVRALLAPYHERLRSELERFGGTVEKFIGDAVMALFGAPVAHEDDPERAVRAALAIRDFALEDGLELRVGITTGEALISLDARPAEGEGMASGDVVNTAARVQAAAPVNGILVDELTARATHGAIEYDDAEQVEAKGKSRPIHVRLAREARARFGVDVAHEARSALVGRERELSMLREAFERARHERTPQLVTLVGVPGIGKSRLVYELFTQVVRPDPELITWRQGRCLAYGEGVTLWALGEIVKAQAGIAEQDIADDVSTKITCSVSDALEGSGEERWVTSHLLRLVGLGDESELGGDRRDEAFAAWRRYLEALAEQRPLVLVFEDLHWADEVLLDFIDELVDWVSDVPLLVVGTARPELLERRPGWSGGKVDATTLGLAPLSDDETARLIAGLIGRPVVAADSQQVLLERAGGNPLYAEQFADLFVERGSAADDLPLPETLQGIIAARLDGLVEAEKDVLRDASVVGKVFWQSSLGDKTDGASAILHSLERKGFVRRQRRSSLEGESEFSFAHALVRDVAYGQIARAERVSKHRRVAEWTEALGRPEDHAEMLAYHYATALELAQSTGIETEQLGKQAQVALQSAGDRAFSLNAFSAASDHYERALALSAEDDPGRPGLLFRRAHALHVAEDARAIEALEEARDALMAAGDRERAGEAEALLGSAFWYRGDQDEARAHMAAARELVDQAGPSVSKARVLAVYARNRSRAGDSSESLKFGREALAIAEALSLDELRVDALTTIAAAKGLLGDTVGESRDLEEALEIALAVNSPEAAVVLNNLAVRAFFAGDVRREHELFLEAQDVGERLGNRRYLRFVQGNLIWTMWALGQWDESLAGADAFIAECESGSPHYMEDIVRGRRGDILLARGHTDAAFADYERALELGRSLDEPQTLLPSLAQMCEAFVQVGRIDEARPLAREFVAALADRKSRTAVVGIIAPHANELGVGEAVRELLGSEPESPWTQAAVALLDGDFVRAGDIYESMHFWVTEARVRSQAAERLVAAGRRLEGEAQLERALAFHRSVGATIFIERAKKLLGESETAAV